MQHLSVRVLYLGLSRFSAEQTGNIRHSSVLFGSQTSRPRYAYPRYGERVCGEAFLARLISGRQYKLNVSDMVVNYNGITDMTLVLYGISLVNRRTQIVKEFCASGVQKKSSVVTLDSIIIKEEEPYPRTHPKQLRLNADFAECVVNSLASVNALTRKCFHKLIKGADSRLTWPSRNTVVRNLIPGLHKATKDAILALLNSVTAVTLNVDVWSSRKQRGYLGITVHFIDLTWKPRHFLLGCPRFTGKHTADAILQLVMEVINEFKIKEKIYLVGTDNGANIVKAFDGWLPGFLAEFDGLKGDDSVESDKDFDQEERVTEDDLEFDDDLAADLSAKIQQEYPQARFALSDRNILVRCFTHTLNLCLKKPYENCKRLKDVIEKVARAINSAHKSGSKSEAVEETFGKSLQKRCATRWNTNFKMAQSAAFFPWDTAGTIFKEKHRLLAGEVKLLKQFVKMMLPFEEMFVSLQDAAYPAICRCIPALYYLRCQLDIFASAVGEEAQQLEKYRKELLQEINLRLGKIETDPLYMAATFLDPNRKVDWCGAGDSEEELSVKEREVRTLMRKLMSVIALPTKAPPTSPAFSPASSSASPFDFLRRDPLSSAPAPSSNHLSVEAELEAYISDVSRSSNPEIKEWNPLDYWKANSTKFKRLATLAREILCATATTAGVERVFSVAGILLSDRRLRTGDVSFEVMLFCKINKDMLTGQKKRKALDME